MPEKKTLERAHADATLVGVVHPRRQRRAHRGFWCGGPATFKALGKKVLVSPDWIDAVSWEDRKVHVAMSRHAVKNSPEWNGSVTSARESRGWSMERWVIGSSDGFHPTAGARI